MNTPHQPQLGPQTPNYTNYHPEKELLKLRQRVGEMLKLGAATPETYLQTIMQLFQEAERRRQMCMGEAEDCLRKHQALVAQAHGFSAMSSILYNIVNGYVTLEERRLLETAQRDSDQAEKEAAAANVDGAKSAAGSVNGHSTQEVASALGTPLAPKSSGGKRRRKP
jgi:hypothetical protein